MIAAETMAIELIKVAMIGVYFLILYFKMDKIENKVNEIRRKMEDKKE